MVEGRHRRLGLNHGAYRGETIEVDRVLGQTLDHARRLGWHVERMDADGAPPLWAMVRTPPNPSRRLYVSAGIHGDEPAGLAAVLAMVMGNAWPEDAGVWVCPCLNPTGLALNQRENADGIDLNRDYRRPQTPEVRSHVAWLARQPRFDTTVCLHEDWEADGFYLYELNEDQRLSPAEAAIRDVARICPIDPSTRIDGREARDGIIRPQVDLDSRPDWPEAFYLVQRGSPYSVTLEAPSDFTLGKRIAALAMAASVVLRATPSFDQ